MLIKDSDVTKALQDIININGEITGIKKFNVEVSSWKTDTSEELSSLKKRTTTIETNYSTKQEVTDKINGIQVGGTNLIRNSNFFQKDAYWAYDTGTGTIISDNSVIGNVLVFKPIAGLLRVFANTQNVWVANEIYTVSFYAKASVANATITPSRSVADNASTVTLTTTWKRYTGTIRSTATSDSGTLSFKVNNVNATYYIAAVKLEKGNKATDWSPAPEDIDYNINTKVSTTVFNELKQTVDENSSTITKMSETLSKKADSSTVTALSNTVNSIKQTADSNSSSISSLTTTVTKVENTANNASKTASEAKTAASKAETAASNSASSASSAATSAANAKKSADTANTNASAAVSTANTAKSTADSAKSTATAANNTANTAKSTADSALSRVNTLTTTVTNQGSSITQLQTSINNKVWKQDITTAVNDIQIGGRNLAESTNQGTTGWGWSMKAGGHTQSEIVENNIRTCKLLRNSTAKSGWSVIEYTRIGRSKYEPNTVYTVSFDVKSNVNTVMNIDLFQGNGTDNLMGSSTAVNRQIKANQWNKLIWIIKTVTTLPSSTGQLLYITGMNSGTGVWYQFKNLKIEKGNKATDWSPAPEDVDSSISAVDSKITTVSNQYTALNQTVNSISATVNSHTSQIATKADNSTVTTINNKVTSLTTDLSGFKTTVSNTYATKNSLSNYATTAAMNSAISQSANSITQSVSATYATKSSLSSYATTASLSAYIAKTDTGTLKSCIEAIADTINITARGGLNLSGNRFTLSSTNTTITTDGTITTKKFVGNGGTIGGWNIDSTSIYSDYLYNATVGYGKYRVSLNKSTGSDSKIFSVRETVKDNVFNYPFYVRSDGYMYSIKGQISGFQFDSNKMSNTVSVYLLPDKDVLHTLRNAIVNNTTSQLTLSQYDLNESGKVDLTDFVVAKNYVLGTKTETDFRKWKYAKTSNITYKLNPSDVKNALSISGTDIWGKTRQTTLGIGTLYSNEISCDNLIVKDPVDYSTFNTFLNTINVRESSTSVELDNFVRNYTIKGNGMLIVNISIWTDTTNDYGTTTAEIYIDRNCVMENRNRMTNSHSSELAGGATFVWWFNDNTTHHIQIKAGSSKEGTKTYTQSIQALFGLQIST